jgi:D-3-phosphoglycerate dehydrogenase
MWAAPWNKATFSSLPNLKLVTINSTGYDLVDISAAKKHKVKIANLGTFSSQSVAEMTFALIFSVVRQIPLLDQTFRNKPFNIDLFNPTHHQHLGFTLQGKTLGVIGLGTIGTRVAQIAQALGMNVLA